MRHIENQQLSISMLKILNLLYLVDGGENVMVGKDFSSLS